LAPGERGLQGKGRRYFFEKKVTKKLSVPGGVGAVIAAASRAESLFASFSEKEGLANLP
jgi:hypothetical protein